MNVIIFEKGILMGNLMIGKERDFNGIFFEKGNLR